MCCAGGGGGGGWRRRGEWGAYNVAFYKVNAGENEKV